VSQQNLLSKPQVQPLFKQRPSNFSSSAHGFEVVLSEHATLRAEKQETKDCADDEESENILEDSVFTPG